MYQTRITAAELPVEQLLGEYCFPERFREAYLLEMQEFVDCVRTGRRPGTTVYDGVRSTAVGYATTEAWRTGHPVQIRLP